MRALGVDVSVRRKLDLVLLDDSLSPTDISRRVEPKELADIASELKPDVIAIDAPPAWGKGGGSRLTEREIRWFGIQSYGTPSDPTKAENPFYDWMRVGFAAFEALAEHYPRYGSGDPRGTAMEVFPHASAVVLSGCLPPTGSTKRDFRASVLQASGVRTDELRSIDLIDAALAALTGIFALRGRFTAPGDPLEGVIVLPGRTLPAGPYRRCVAPPAHDEQPHLPGLAPCGCGDPGCTSLTRREFAPGHEAKRKSNLWRRARHGDEAVHELRRRGWELPPEMR